MKNKLQQQRKLLLHCTEAQEKLNRYLLEISMDWFKNDPIIFDVVWKIYRNRDKS